ncbi:MAG: MBL fold metallo-hydrolase [Undibacterium sp.]|nr:MBL fold metallo-hydrolase [Undibacterium sp.]
MRTPILIFPVLFIALTHVALADEGVKIRMQGSSFAPNQAKSPLSSVQEVPVTFDIVLDQQGQYRSVSSSHYPGDIEFRYLSIGTKAGLVVADLLGWRTGKELARLDAKAAQNNYADLLFSVPHLLMKNARDRLAMSTPIELQAQYQYESFIDAAGRPATIVVDKQSGDVVSARSATKTYEYSDYVNHQGQRQAQKVTEKRGQTVVAMWSHVQSEKIDHLDEHAFILPYGYQEKQDKGVLRAIVIAPDTYRVEGSASGYHTHFSVGSHSVAVYDAPVSPVEGALVKALIEKTAPNKKIAYLILTHTHGDHINGAPAYFNKELQIFTGKDGKQALNRQFGAEHDVNIQEVGTRKDLDLGGRSIQIYPAPNSHASEMLFSYDAMTKTLFQGDLFALPEVGPVPVGFTVNQELNQLIQDYGLKVERITSVHGRVGTLAELQQTVALKNTETASAK